MLCVWSVLSDSLRSHGLYPMRREYWLLFSRPVCGTLHEPMDCSTPGLSVPHHLPKFAYVHVHFICDAIQPSHPLTPGVGCYLLLQGIFPTQGSNKCLASPALAGRFFAIEPPQKPIPSMFSLCHEGAALKAPLSMAKFSFYSRALFFIVGMAKSYAFMWNSSVQAVVIYSLIVLT